MGGQWAHQLRATQHANRRQKARYGLGGDIELCKRTLVLGAKSVLRPVRVGIGVVVEARERFRHRLAPRKVPAARGGLEDAPHVGRHVENDKAVAVQALKGLVRVRAVAVKIDAPPLCKHRWWRPGVNALEVPFQPIEANGAGLGRAHPQRAAAVAAAHASGLLDRKAVVGVKRGLERGSDGAAARRRRVGRRVAL